VADVISRTVREALVGGSHCKYFRFRRNGGDVNRHTEDMTHVLVVDDDPTVREVVASYLRDAGYEVTEAADGNTALQRAAQVDPQLVILDLMLPGLDGLEVCRRLRATSDVPVIMLTALGEEADRVSGLELGADDYVTKPFSPRELTLRVGSVLRRAEPMPVDAASLPDVVSDGDLVIDSASRRVTLEQKPLSLTIREFDLLRFLIAHPGVAYNREELLAKVWGWDFGDQSTVTVHVRRLREKIELDPSHPERLVTVWGVGYRWESADQRRSSGSEHRVAKGT
jgi:DNA-binding response OmpR family regulator